MQLPDSLKDTYTGLLFSAMIQLVGEMFAWTRQIFVHWALPTTKLLKYAVIDTIAEGVLDLFLI